MRSGAVTASRRAEIEAEIDRLIAFLDIADGDPDLEPTAGNPGYPDECEPSDDPEPSLAATGATNQIVGWTKHGGGDDGEHGDDTGIGDAMGINSDDEPDTDKEPSLGWTLEGFCFGTADLEPNGDEEDFTEGLPDDALWPSKMGSDRPAARDALMEAKRLGAAVRVLETRFAVYQAGRMYPRHG